MTVDLSVKMTDIAILVATLLGPILAVWASEWRASRRAEEDTRLRVFRNLMSTRGSRLHTRHVDALNAVEFAFPKGKFAAVDDALRVYIKHLRKTGEAASPDKAVFQSWLNKSGDLLVDLLHTMSIAVGTPYAKAELGELSYVPDAHMQHSNDLIEIRSLALAVLKEGRPLNIRPLLDADALRTVLAANAAIAAAQQAPEARPAPQVKNL